MTQKQRLKAWLEQSRKTSEGMLASFKTPQEWTHQVHPSANHALWFVGHMTSTDNFIIGMLAPDKQIELPPAYKAKFGMGSQPTSNPADYPPPEEMLSRFRERRQTLLAAIDKLSDADLDKPAPKEVQNFIKDTADALQLAIYHEGLHSGQVSIARRSLGHAPLMGGEPG